MPTVVCSLGLLSACAFCKLTDSIVVALGLFTGNHILTCDPIGGWCVGGMVA